MNPLRVLGSLIVLGWLAGAAQAVYPPAVKDDARFFKTETVEKANKKIREIYEKYKKDVVIETLTKIPEDQEKKYKDLGKVKFFVTYSLDRIKTLGVNGIYVLVSKDPKYLQIEMDSDTRKNAFKNADRKKVSTALLKAFGDDKQDAGLLAALDAIEAALKASEKK